MPKESPVNLPWYNIRARAATEARASAAEILIYGNIGESWWEDTVTAKDFVREIAALDVAQLTIRINSFGGSVPDGIAIYNAIRRHPAHVTVEVDAVAYSIASLIAMAGDTVHMAANALLMIHAPWMVAIGNAVDLRERADMLDSYAAAMKTSYAARGIDEATVDGWLSDGGDHFFTAAEALDAGLIDGVTAEQQAAASAKVRAEAETRFPHGRAQSVAASFKTMESTMSEKDKKAASPQAAGQNTPENQTSAATPAPSAAPVDTSAAVQAALAADKTRRTEIRAAFSGFMQQSGVEALMRECEDDPAMTVEAASHRLLSHLGKSATPVAGVVQTMEDETDKRRDGMAKAMLVRGNIDKNDDTANPYRGYSLMDMARESLARCGISVSGMGKMDVVRMAFTHSTSDFPALLENVARKSLLRGYEEANETFQIWTRKGSLGDFKETSRAGLNAFGGLDLVPEGSEYKYGTFGDTGQKVVLSTYGKMFSITRQAIINDDLNAFTDIPRRMGRAAIRKVGDLVYAILNSNMQMSDGLALFHANHANLLTASAINTDSVDAMQVAMALQTVPAGKDEKVVTNIPLKYLLVPFALKGTANVVRTSQFEVGQTKRYNTTPNSVANTFEVISDARLDMASSKAWYGAADGTLFDTVEVNYLDGNEQPYLEQQEGWKVDGTEFKVRLDAGVAPLDFRALAKNPGA